MKADVFVVGDQLVTPLGIGSATNFVQLLDGRTAIKPVADTQLSGHRIHAARIDEQAWLNKISRPQRFTRLEQLFILSLQAMIDEYRIPLDRSTLVLLSTTKGNVALLHRASTAFPPARVHLPVMADELQGYFGFENRFVTISNACISGALAISVARQLLRHHDGYQQAVVIGGDEISRFIVSGFDAFQALADEPCRPFDRDRKGLNLGEAIAGVYLSKTPARDAVRIMGVGSYNDANHISGPSRTGEGLYRSIAEAMREAGAPPLDFISAHGTATRYNDEMESIALQRCGLSAVPLHSLKGYYGHTLGASGLLETVLGIHSLKNNRLIPSKGFMHQGTSQALNIITADHGDTVKTGKQPDAPAQPLRTFLKTASGFGGCNIATVFQKA
ncbi:beta-ketoacyl synthase [Parapedobacter sp. ISTM3]|uniref:beta-ketoacyl-[acyl-carrier-protein] synthase family protein n=1 Tax=Parapedobacter sp. ISTM3 TaxID=2800130 RepID=UPI0019049EC1|nr:beta-ketoacyl synthase N-terminal-like domain-containing protein [Parapedobacter sp. ISTM3]MBK1440806.1 beta-ketoacyl synthase [Parapedobacter sp. ISTM3]